MLDSNSLCHTSARRTNYCKDQDLTWQDGHVVTFVAAVGQGYSVRALMPSWYIAIAHNQLQCFPESPLSLVQMEPLAEKTLHAHLLESAAAAEEADGCRRIRCLLLLQVVTGVTTMHDAGIVHL
jgi:hypothetical protein